jgi:PAS domain S-box-containing protein
LQGLAGNPECEWSRYFLLVNGQEFSFMTRPLEGCGQLASRVCYFKFRNSIVSLGEDVEYNHIKYRHFFDDFPFGLIRYGLYGKLLAANTAAAQMFGYESQSEIVALINGSSVGDVLLKNESMLIKLEKIALESAGTWFRGEVRFVRQDGTAFDGELFLLATSDHNPSFYGVIRDISPQKGAEREFQENQKRMRSSFQMLKDLIDSHSNAFQISNHIESPQSLPKASRLLEMNYIEAALRKTKGRVQPAARLLGISRYTLIRQIAKMGIDTKKFKD